MSQIIPLFTVFLLLVKYGEPLECKRKEPVVNTPVISSNCYRKCEYPPKPMVCEYDLNVEWIQTMSGHCGDCPFKKEDCNLEKCVPVDGSSRPAAVVNGTFPGPSIQVCEGDTIRVKVSNNLESGAGFTMHWHGIHMRGTNWMDGVPRVTQCPIARGSSFVYEFIAEPAGTHWWHSHAGYQRASGALGPLIVRKPQEIEFNSKEYDFDLPEHIMMLTDWSNIVAVEIALKANVPAIYPRTPSITILMNGKGERIDFFDESGQVLKTPNAMFEVEAGMRYKMRLIGAFVASCTTEFYIENHNMTIIGTDGHETIPHKIGSLKIGPGERYDFVLHANAVPSTYCIHAVGLGNSSCLTHSTYILKYKTSSLDIPVCLEDDLKPVPHFMGSVSKGLFSSIDLASSELFDPDFYHVDSTHYITITSFGVFSEGRIAGHLYGRPLVDNVVFIPPIIPFVTNEPKESEICQPNINRTFYDNCGIDHCFCTNVLKIKLGQVVELVLLNIEEDLISHPMHMHGGSFRVIGSDSFHGVRMTLDDVIQLDKQGGLLRHSLEKSVLKDTVLVPENGYTVLRLKADNPGYWMFHCHILNHGERGMAMIIQVGEPSEMPKPPSDFPTCEHWQPK